MDQPHANVPLTPPVPAHNYTVPPLADLFSQSWHLMTKKLGSLVILMLAAFAAGIAAFLIAGGIAVAVGLSSGLLQSLRNADSLLAVLPKIHPAAWISLGLIFILFIAVGMLISFFSVVAPLLFLDQQEDRMDLAVLFKKTVRLILPLVAVNVITVLLVWGSMFFFIVPVFFVSVFLTFSTYEVILAGKRGTAALRSSAQIVSQHFGTLLIRSLALFLLSIAVLYLVPQLLLKSSPNLSWVASLYRFIAQWLVQMYSIVFSYLLYRQLKKATDTSRSASIVWMVVVAVLGWLIFALFLVAGLTFGLSQLKKDFAGTRSGSKGSASSYAPAKITSRVPSNCGLSIPIPDTRDTENGKTRYWIYEERAVVKDTFRNLAPEVTATENVLSAYLNYKNDDQRFKPEDTSYASHAGIDILCVKNIKDWALDDFISAAEKNTKYTVKKNRGTVTWGDVTVYSVLVEGVDTRGDYFKEPLNLGVTKDGKRLFIIQVWGPADKDPQASSIQADTYAILDGLQYR